MRSIPKQSLLVLLLTLTSYSFPTFAETEDPLFASIRKAGEVKAALASNSPYQFVSPSGEAKGSSVDLQRIVLKAMGLPALKPVLTEWTAMVPALQAHQFDYVGAGLNITETTCKAVVFSAPTYAAQIGLYVLPGNPKHLMSVADLAHRPDITVSAIRSSAQYDYLPKRGVKPAQITIVPDIQAGIATVIGGRVDAFVLGQFTIPHPEEKGLEVVVDKESPIYAAGIAFRKENIRFRNAFNQQLVPLIRGGMLQKLYAEYGIPNGDSVARLLASFGKASDVVPGCE
ncbi:transporter substrate-binding domain-containing protein [Bradyrhizobium brasilense]|uniref:transporter substrate-binding domain-containing protein n=1 Tax=Bradyrhizobium brasilense TaxID=1419277 RepID=UPI0024B1FC26|nr:transporter substrate-binding domain-containing protein [Bradyrhizobium australafricanum]WFU31359.1 transporter substrate-binding domain-containing protein [Bradyrhizobium australafricanum]